MPRSLFGTPNPSRGRLSALACRCWSVWLSRARDAHPQKAIDIARQAPGRGADHLPVRISMSLPVTPGGSFSRIMSA